MQNVHQSRRPMIAFDHPIPIRDEVPTTEDYHEIPIAPQDPRYREALVDARKSGVAGENYYARADGTNPPYLRAISGAIRELWCRQTIVTMLTKVNERLAVHGAEVFLWDAYRPIACQEGLWEFFWSRVQGEMPHAQAQAISERVRQYVSDPRVFDANDPKTWPVHTTGAALDLTLRDVGTGELLDMGASFDHMSLESHTDYFERLLSDGEISGDAPQLRNRRLLYWAMRGQGFTNYSYEFWHFDYGNQLYVSTMRQLGHRVHAAWYGYVPLPGQA
jgi:D-alanyl-D-alanine dipeptidase